MNLNNLINKALNKDQINEDVKIIKEVTLIFNESESYENNKVV